MYIYDEYFLTWCLFMSILISDNQADSHDLCVRGHNVRSQVTDSQADQHPAPGVPGQRPSPAC